MGLIFGSMERVRPCEIEDIENEYKNPTSHRTTNDDQRRYTTDTCCLTLFSIFLIVLLCFVGYCIQHGDIFRIINGYDNCGNVCGRSHGAVLSHEKKKKCQERLQNTGPYHISLKYEGRLCVSNCSEFKGYRHFFNRCIPSETKKTANTILSKTRLKDFFVEVSEDFQFCWKEFIYLCLIALVLSLAILVLFRYLVGLVVWIVLIGVVLTSIVATVLVWILWKESKKPDNVNKIPYLDSGKTETYFAFAIISTIITVVVILIIFVLRSRIQLVVQLFREAGKAIAVMPGLLLEPIVTFVCLAVVISLWFYFCLWIESSGILTEKRTNRYYYQKDVAMKISRWYNFFAMLWMAQFIIGCQHMVIAGAVSKWYFTRNKSKVRSPIFHGVYNLTRYHLGSVALGSFLIATVQFARVILKIVEKYLKGREGQCVKWLLKCCQCCLYCFEKIIKFLSRNAYIEVAIHGYPFCRAGRQAFKLLSSNVLRVAAINSVGDFVLFLGKVVVVVATVLIGLKMFENNDGVRHVWVPLTLAGLFAYSVSHCFMAVYEMTIDTIFLCFCEDCEKNDGISKPYYMSRGLMEFVQNSKKD